MSGQELASCFNLLQIIFIGNVADAGGGAVFEMTVKAVFVVVLIWIQWTTSS
jgi:hypothetical protein